MEVFLVRHAIAHERNGKRWPDDSKRPLTAAGIAKYRKAARGLVTLLPESAALLASPYKRARETADLLAQAARHMKVVECGELAASESAQRAFELLQTRREKAVILVGHEPYLSHFMAEAIAGAHLAVEFKKGGAACLEFEGRPKPSRATLKWMLSPKVLRALR